MKAADRRLQSVYQALDDKKGEDIVALDISAIASFTDYFVIATGRNTRQTQAMADAVMEKLKEVGLRAGHVEGYSAGEWILLDYVDFVVHIFVPSHRDFYGLERLWADARRLGPASGSGAEGRLRRPSGSRRRETGKPPSKT